MIPTVVADALDRKREAFNNKFAVARLGSRRVTPEAFTHILRNRVIPLAAATAIVDRSQIEVVLDVLYDIALELLSRGILGPEGRGPLVDELWADLLPRLARWVVELPREVIGSLSNAVWALSEEPTIAKDWMKSLGDLAPHCSDAATLLTLGKVLAWREGMAHWRATALEAWNCLPTDLALICLGLDPALGDVRRDEIGQKLQNDPWFVPGNEQAGVGPKLVQVGRVGGFEGFGGQFFIPPELLVSKGIIHAFDDETCYSIHADGFGVTMQRFGRDVPDPDAAGLREFFVDNGVVRWKGLEASFPHLRCVMSFVELDRLLAVTLVDSHWVWLVAVVGVA